MACSIETSSSIENVSSSGSGLESVPSVEQCYHYLVNYLGVTQSCIFMNTNNVTNNEVVSPSSSSLWQLQMRMKRAWEVLAHQHGR